MKTTLIVVAVFVAVFSMSLTVHATTPQTMNYQGILKSTAGAPFTGAKKLTFKIYDAASGGNLFWTEIQPTVNVAKGQFNVTLGAGSPAVPLALAFDKPYWLGVTVDPETTEMTPRQPLTTVPYAFRAAAADTLVGSAPVSLPPNGLIVGTNQLVVSGGKVGIGTATPTEQLEITGNLKLPPTTATVGQIKQGDSTLLHTFGTSNFFAGYSAGNLTMSGTDNLAIGRAALQVNTTGVKNIAIGVQALVSNTTGNNNTATGWQALYWNNGGSNNTATGYQSLAKNNSGANNTASGFSALFSNTTGTLNSAFGSSSLYSNSTGYSNTGVGISALDNNTTASDNVAVGYRALYLQADSLDHPPSSTNNTAVGNYALYYNQIYWNPFDLAWEGGTGNTAIGRSALFVNNYYGGNTGANNTAVGVSALQSNVVGNNNTAVGFAADVSYSDLMNATAIGYYAKVSTSNTVRIGNTSVSLIGGQVGFSNQSDIRIKKDIEGISYGLDFIRQLKPVQYRLKQGNDRIDFGFIAQDVEALLGTEYNLLGIGGDEERSLSLRYTDFVAPLVKAVQEQQVIIDQMKAELAELKRLLDR